MHMAFPNSSRRRLREAVFVMGERGADPSTLRPWRDPQLAIVPASIAVSAPWADRGNSPWFAMLLLSVARDLDSGAGTDGCLSLRRSFETDLAGGIML